MAVNVAVTTTKIDLAPRHRCAGQMASGLNESQSADGLESAARLLLRVARPAPNCSSNPSLRPRHGHVGVAHSDDSPLARRCAFSANQFDAYQPRGNGRNGHAKRLSFAALAGP